MSWKFLAGLASLGYLSTQGHKAGKPKPNIYSADGTSNGMWNIANSIDIQKCFMSGARSFLMPQSLGGGCCNTFSDRTYPKNIWGWRCKDPNIFIPIWKYADYNDCTIDELCAREGNAQVYINYGITDYDSNCSSRIWLEVWGKSHGYLRGGKGKATLLPHPTNDKLRVDENGNEWYYITKAEAFQKYTVVERQLKLKKNRETLFSR